MFQDPRNPEVGVPPSIYKFASGSGSDRSPGLPVCPVVSKNFLFPSVLFVSQGDSSPVFLQREGKSFAPSFPEAPGFPYLLRRPKVHTNLPFLVLAQTFE